MSDDGQGRDSGQPWLGVAVAGLLLSPGAVLWAPLGAWWAHRHGDDRRREAVLIALLVAAAGVLSLVLLGHTYADGLASFYAGVTAREPSLLLGGLLKMAPVTGPVGLGAGAGGLVIYRWTTERHPLRGRRALELRQERVVARASREVQQHPETVPLLTSTGQPVLGARL